MTLFERIGRFFFQKSRLWLLLVFLSAPFLVIGFHVTARFFHLRDLETTFDSAALKAKTALEKRAQREKFLQRYANAAPYFINEVLEAKLLCQKELARLQQLAEHPACQEKEAVRKRIAFLQSAENRLLFNEDHICSSATVKESEETLVHSVELDKHDLEHLLCLIENQAIGDLQPDPTSPQLQITHLTLVPQHQGQFLLKDLTLLKREWLKH